MRSIFADVICASIVIFLYDVSVQGVNKRCFKNIKCFIFCILY